MPTHLEVRRDDHTEVRAAEELDTPLADGQVRVAIDLVALTANNITYALMGDALDYWSFFPSHEEGWGRLPAMGFGDVTASTVEGVEEGTRLYGWFPMSSSVVLEPEVRRMSLVDTVAHRAGHAPVYRTYQRVDEDPMYQREHEALDALLRGLYVTSWLVDAKLVTDHADAETVVVTSASSKTALALAHRRATAGRGGRTIGLTSPRNVEAVVARDLYDEVIAYADAGSLGADGDAVVVDFAGNADTLGHVHRALEGALVASLTVGITHGAPTGLPDDVPGPAPAFFFAPTEVERQIANRGAEGYATAVATDLGAFVEWASTWLQPEPITSVGDAEDAYERVRTGAVPADVGVVLRPSAW